MGLFGATFTALKRVTTGSVVKQIDTGIMEGNCTLSLRLKRSGSDTYVVLAGVAPGNYQYFSMTPYEFGEFEKAVQEIGRDLSAGNSQS